MDPLGKWVVDYWWVALITGIIAIIMLLLASFVPAVRKSGPNFAIYGLFTLCGGYTVGYFCAVNDNRLVYFALWLLTSVAIAFALYAFCSSAYMQTLSAILFILAGTILVFQCFIIFTDIDLVYLTLVMIGVVVYGFYLNYDIRRMVRGNLYDSVIEDAVTGAVRIWLEVVFVFCRLIELIGGCFFKNKH